MHRLDGFGQRSYLNSLLLAVLAVGLGVGLGLALLAAHQLLPASVLTTLAGRLGSLLLPLAGMTLLVTISLYSPLAALLIGLVLAPYGPHIPLDISLGAGLPDLSVARLLTAVLLLLILVQAARGQRRLRPLAWSDLVYVLFGLAMVLSAPASRWGTVPALQAILDAYLLPLAGLYVARQLVQGPRELRWVMAAAVVIGSGLAFLIIREQLTGEVLLYRAGRGAAYSASLRKVQSLMGNAAPMGVTTAMTLPLGLVGLMWIFSEHNMEPQRRRLLLWLLVLVNLFIALGVFMTYNRASWLGMLLTVLVLLALRPRARRLLLPALLVGLVLVVVFWQQVVSSAAVTERLLEDRSINYRTTAAALALDMARRHPLWGIGFGNFGFEAYETYGWQPFREFGQIAPAHNSYLFILVSGGLLALVPYLAWLGLMAWTGLRRYRRLCGDSARQDVLASGVALFLTYVLAIGTFDNAQTVYMNLVFFVLLGAVWGATERGAKRLSEKSALSPRPRGPARPEDGAWSIFRTGSKWLKGE